MWARTENFIYIQSNLRIHKSLKGTYHFSRTIGFSVVTFTTGKFYAFRHFYWIYSLALNCTRSSWCCPFYDGKVKVPVQVILNIIAMTFRVNIRSSGFIVIWKWFYFQSPWRFHIRRFFHHPHGFYFNQVDKDDNGDEALDPDICGIWSSLSCHFSRSG